MAIERISLLGVPVDILPQEDLEKELLSLLEKPGTKQVVFLSIWNLLKARGKSKYAECVRNADLILPTSKSILKGATKLGLSIPVRYNPFAATIIFLSILDSHYKSLYLFGGRKRALAQAERNVHTTFKNARVVGRYVGYYPKAIEPQIVAAMYKASPSLVLVSDGIAEKDYWAYNRRNSFASSTFVYYKDIINIFAKRTKRVSDATFEKGLEIWVEILHNPLKIFLIFPFIWYKILLVHAKVTKSS